MAKLTHDQIQQAAINMTMLLQGSTDTPREALDILLNTLQYIGHQVYEGPDKREDRQKFFRDFAQDIILNAENIT